MNRKSESQSRLRTRRISLLAEPTPRDHRPELPAWEVPSHIRQKRNSIAPKSHLAHARIATLVPMSSPRGCTCNDGGSVSAPATPLSVPLGPVTRRREHWTAEGAGRVGTQRERVWKTSRPAGRHARSSTGGQHSASTHSPHPLQAVRGENA
jgi:hypothetical protein